jgi:hypothetical protein
MYNNLVKNVDYVHFKSKVVDNGFICSYCNEFFSSIHKLVSNPSMAIKI